MLIEELTCRSNLLQHNYATSSCNIGVTTPCDVNLSSRRLARLLNALLGRDPVQLALPTRLSLMSRAWGTAPKGIGAESPNGRKAAEQRYELPVDMYGSAIEGW